MSDTDTDASTDLGEVTIRRIYDAPRELVFECMTTPEHLTHFWGPIGVSTPVESIRVDLQVGGAFETDMVNDATGEVYPTRAVFTVIDPPETLGFAESLDEGVMRTTITFLDMGDGRTETITHQENVPPMYRSAEALAGLETSFVRFDAYLATLT